MAKVTPRKSLNKAYLKQKIARDDFDRFRANLEKLLDIKENETEEHYKNEIASFLKDTWYKGKHAINTKADIDLAIYNEESTTSNIGTLIEVKRPVNRGEMISTNNLNAKATQELLLYYLRELEGGNTQIRHLIVTNLYEWFVFDAQQFTKIIDANKNLLKEFHDFEAGNLFGKRTADFYERVAKPAIEKVLLQLEFTHFDLRLRSKWDEKQQIALYKILSPEHLLKLPFANDSNSLDNAFYSELLHIIGLTEIKKGSKKLIERNKESQRHNGSLVENAITQLDSLDKMVYLESPSQYGATNEDRLFHAALELAITWINRILFLKLLEAQLLRYHHGDKKYSFLNFDRIHNYDDLNSLFFQVLARRHEQRNDNVKSTFPHIPYLNSSLFEVTAFENQMIVISNLRDDLSLPIYRGTVLKDRNGKKLSGKMNAIEYLFRFLNAYDFNSEGAESIQEENKTLINAAVLGLIFEKINGYKDGSFFTPGFITMYMARETIRRAVIDKFNAARNVGTQHTTPLQAFTNLIDIYNAIGREFTIAQANDIINSLKICDPAVGSGHFLVSALNEIIAIKSELGILFDRTGKVLFSYSIIVENDELIVQNPDGTLFEYHPDGAESQRVQETLFHEKQTIIENCLFGVDINPNSVKICRLRLWIELLKNAYYRAEPQPRRLETLPNIDINIKCGNSLVSRFPLDADLGRALKRKGRSITEYRNAVQTYRNATDKSQKRQLAQLISEIKSDFRTEISSNDPKKKKLEKVNNELTVLTTQGRLFEETKKEEKAREAKIIKLNQEQAKLEAEIEEIKSNKIYLNAFEWRFEFPEVLDKNGDFIGFDVIIGNPPYGVSKKGFERKHLIENISKVPDYEIYYWFIDRSYDLLKKNGLSNYIIPNSILFNVYAQSYRLNLFEKWTIEEILDCTGIRIFEDATVRNIIFCFRKSGGGNLLRYKKTNNVQTFGQLILRPLNDITKETVESNNGNWGLIFRLNKNILELIRKIRTDSASLKELFPETSQGLIAYDRYKGQSKEIIKSRAFHHFSNPKGKFKKWLYGEDVTRYYIKWNEKEYIDYCDKIANPREPKYFIGKRILIREITNPRIYASLTEKEFYNDPAVIIIKEGTEMFSIETLLAILNSKLATFYHFNSSPKATKGAFPKILVCDINNFPLPTVTTAQKVLLEELVEKVLSAKRADAAADTSADEAAIDRLVYELYGLDEDEIKIIESSGIDF